MIMPLCPSLLLVSQLNEQSSCFMQSERCRIATTHQHIKPSHSKLVSLCTSFIAEVHSWLSPDFGKGEMERHERGNKLNASVHRLSAFVPILFRLHSLPEMMPYLCFQYCRGVRINFRKKITKYPKLNNRFRWNDESLWSIYRVNFRWKYGEYCSFVCRYWRVHVILRFRTASDVAFCVSKILSLPLQPEKLDHFVC